MEFYNPPVARSGSKFACTFSFRPFRSFRSMALKRQSTTRQCAGATKDCI
ncbi:unnamed protein product [Acidithrix sp. C25]|nr:unnamed protein product [Acidithrix sp. C25]